MDLDPSPPQRTWSGGDRRVGHRPPPGTARALAAAVPAEGHERTGVAVYVTVRDLARTGAAPDACSRRDGAVVADELERWHTELDRGDDDHAVQEAATALAWWHVRPSVAGQTLPPGVDPPPVPADGPGRSGRASSAARVVTGDRTPARPHVLGPTLAALRSGHVLRVVNFHSTPARLRERVEAEITDCATRYSPVGPADVQTFLTTGSWGTPRPPVVLAFFDGFRNNVEVALPACERVGATAWFHVVTGFVDCPPRDQPGFAREHVIRVAPEEVAAGERLAMTWDDVAALAERHAVGAHTATHAVESDVVGAERVEAEVAGPLRQVAGVTGRPADTFAWLGGTPAAPSTDAGRAVADAGVPFLVSGLAVERLRAA